MRPIHMYLCAILIGACGKQESKARPAPDSLQLDKVSNRDGAIASDGSNDGAILVSVAGPVVGMAVISCDAKGAPANGQQWDTYPAGRELPAKMDVPLRSGEASWQLGVFERDALLNAANGSLAPLADGPHDLTLWLSDSGYFSKDNHFIVLAERPDHAVVPSNVFTF